MQPLPIDPVVPELCAALQGNGAVVLSADPGAGKTTRVPLVLLEQPWLRDMRLIMLEPRRLAAQRAAAYMAHQLGEEVGETVGYRIRGESALSGRTRLEVVTEGILTRQLQADTGLAGSGIVIFDEFHERSIHADLGLALTLDVQKHLRPDLRILIMSATLDGLALSSLLGGAPVIRSEGRAFPVTTHYLRQPHEGPIEPLVVSTIRRVLRDEPGDLLVFLPGQREIRRVASLLSDAGDAADLPIRVVMLYGDAPRSVQHEALAPAPGGLRKVILSTSIAETSLTIDGVRVVIDAGLARTPRFDPRRGMSGLVTTPVSQAGAEQRRGRAGRQQPGSCHRLWTEQQHAALPRFAQPEIVNADLAPLALELARWGDPLAAGLRFLDPPPAAHLAQARGLLEQLAALDTKGALTAHGRAMAELPVHPRLAHMLIRGKELGIPGLACDAAALLDERDLLRGERDTEIDLHSRWYALRHGRARDAAGRERTLAQAERLRSLLKAGRRTEADDRLGILLALAYPERVARRLEGGRFQMANGSVGVLPKGSMLSRHAFLAVGDVDGAAAEVKIFLAEPLAEAEIRSAFGDLLSTDEEIHWDTEREAVAARKVTRFGALELGASPLPLDDGRVTAALIAGIRLMGLDVLPWNRDALSLRERSEWLRKRGLVGPEWPELSGERLRDTLEEWLAPYLTGMSKRTHLARLDCGVIVRSRFTHQQLRELDRLAPTHFTVPTGSRIPIDYAAGDSPVLAVRLQEMFGETRTPTVAGGNVNVLIHLLSPAQRPIAVTQDLPSFWANAYADVRKDMRGRYPKHHWPENPLEAKPTRRAKRKGE